MITSLRITASFLFLLSCSFLSGCQFRSSSSLSSSTHASQRKEKDAGRFPSDALGRSVALAAPARRAIILGPGAVESAFAMGAASQIVGRDASSDFPRTARKIAVVGDYRGPNLERCIAIKPDLVVIQGEGQSRAQLDEWSTKIGAPVAALGAQTVAGVGVEIQKLGVYLGQPQKAKKLAAHFAQIVKSAPKPVSRPRVFVEIGRSPLWSAGQNTLVGDVLAQAGMQSAASIRGYQAYNLENLAAQKLDFYLVPTFKSRLQTLRELRTLPAFSSLEVVQRGAVLTLSPDAALRPGPRLLQTVRLLRAVQFAR